MTNDNPPPPSWLCLDCQFSAGGASLCRANDGSHTFETLARAYMTDSEDGTAADLRHRAMDCVTEMVREVPGAAVGFLVVACAAARDAAQLAVLAAGPLEDLLEAHGPVVVQQLESIAKVDPRFRLMVSGTWGRNRIDPDVWARLVAVVSPGPVMDHDHRTPSAGTSASIVTSAELVRLFAPAAPGRPN